MLTVCIPTYNRYNLVIESISKVIDNKLVTEIRTWPVG